MRALPLLVLLCGCPGDAVSRCGALVMGVSAPQEEAVEVVVERAFQHSPDARLHDVCAAMQGWTVIAEEEVHAPADVEDQVDAGQSIGGYAWLKTHEVHVRLNLGALPHEMAHVAQGCDAASVKHLNWENDVDPELLLVEDGACLDSCP